MSPTDDTLLRLLAVGRSLVTELDPDAVLTRILDEGREITGARYAALGVLNEERTELERFITAGIDDEAQARIGAPPRGRGILGMLIANPVPVRVADVTSHVQSYGFPAGHPPMTSFLGVPILIRGQVWGNLYLTDKSDGGAFTDVDQESAMILADWAATAIENARLHHRSEERRKQLERAVLGLEAARDIAAATGGSFELHRMLELIAQRGRTLVAAGAMLILQQDGDALVVVASAGHVVDANGRRIGVTDGLFGRTLVSGRPERIEDLPEEHRRLVRSLGVEDARTKLLVPMTYRGSTVGVIAAFGDDRRELPFTASDEETMLTFAASAATAVAVSHSVEADRLRSAIAAAEAERQRWARELHDETLQALGGLRVLLASAIRRGGAQTQADAIRQSIGDIEEAIENLRGIIADLRPSLLDDLGLRPAIEALIERRRAGGLTIVGEIELHDRNGRSRPMAPELETTVYRLVQEALTNIVKHARAQAVHVSVTQLDGVITVQVRDDGIGFDTDAKTVGFGLAGIRERIYLAGGTFELHSGEDGTLLRATITDDASVPRLPQVVIS